MTRIRTVKPELLKHVGLFDLELETKLPIRISFVGLFTCCDRDGRFKWCHRTLKTDILPHDDVDFSFVLDALLTRGFIKKYKAFDKDYGMIPTWDDHQFINNRESKSVIPDITEGVEYTKEILQIGTRKPRVDDATQGEGKGKEGKGKEGNINTAPNGAEYKSSKGKILNGILLERFNKFWKIFDYKKDKANAADSFFKINPDEELFENIILGAKRCASERPSLIAKGQTPKMAQGWLIDKRWEDEYNLDKKRHKETCEDFGVEETDEIVTTVLKYGKAAE